MRLRFHIAVAADIDDICGWYVEHYLYPAIRLNEDFEAALRRIEAYPHLCVRINGLRRLQLARFPCHLYYHCGERGEVHLVGAAHAHNNPEAILGRL